MKSKPSIGLIILAALILSFVPAGGITTQSASAQTFCDAAQFVADVTVPDGTAFTTGSTFLKTWRLKNVGSCTWTTSYNLVFVSGEQMGGPASVALPQSVAPGQTVDVSVTLTAPGTPGTYTGFWQFKNTSGTLFGIGSTASKPWWVKIQANAPQQLITAFDFTQNICSAQWSYNGGPIPCPPNPNKIQFGYVQNLNNPVLESGVAAGAPSLLTVPQNKWYGQIRGIYQVRPLARDHFQATIGCQYQAYQCYVTFELDYIAGGNLVTIWKARERYDGLVAPVDVDLTQVSYKRIDGLVLIVTAFGSATDAMPIWVAPRIVRYVSGTIPTSTPVVSTSTPVPPTSTSGCDRAQFVSDVTIPDGTVFPPNTTFTKTWRLKNVGTCTWTTSYQLVFQSGNQMGAPDSVFLPQTVVPGQIVDLSVILTSPSVAGSYRGYWLLKNPTGTLFGIGTNADKPFWVDIMVSGSATPVPSTSTPVPSTVTPVPTTTGTDTSNWNIYQNVKYGFLFKFPPGSSVTSQSDNSGRIYLPLVVQGTNLKEKYVDISVVEGAATCKSPYGSGGVMSSQNVTINGIAFLKESATEGAVGNIYDWVGYSTVKGNACISLTFVLHSLNPG